ncbi:MAG: TIGR00282 family metallophosphoesterase [Eubacteriales bacterium]
MIFRVLAIGDIVGEAAVVFLRENLSSLKKEHEIHMVVANGENVSGLGVTPAQARDVFDCGVDIITLGNHTWNRIQIADFLDSCRDIIRPANYAGRVAGEGVTVWDSPLGHRVGVMNLLGRVNLNANLDSPFKVAKRILRETDCDFMLVDFHGEATSEKGAFGWHFDGKVAAVWGTHTHVPTADQQVLPKGTGFVTDLGMTGPVHSVLGILPEQSVNLFLGGMPRKYQVATGPQKLGACIFSIDTDTGLCVGVKRCDLSQWSPPSNEHNTK